MVGRAGLQLVRALLVVVAAASIVFVLLHLAGDPLAVLAPPGTSPEDLAAIEKHYGLDQPLARQYTIFLGDLARGDFGESWRSGRPAIDVALERMPATLALAAAALALSLAVGLTLGAIAGLRPGGFVDFLATSVALLGQTIPAFWLGTMLILVFAVRLEWLPSSGNDEPGSLVLPAIALAAYPAATLTRLVRVSVRETMRADYIRTAYGKGLATRSVVWSHALRNALLPALAYMGVQAGFLIGGAAVIEWVFAYPGLGQLALQSVASRDIPVVMAYVVIVALLIVCANLISDLAAAMLDPRLRTGTGAQPLGGVGW